jgi:hypothetical protein
VHETLPVWAEKDETWTGQPGKPTNAVSRGVWGDEKGAPGKGLAFDKSRTGTGISPVSLPGMFGHIK